MKHAWLVIAHNEFEILQMLLDALDHPEADIYVHIDKKVKEMPALHAGKSVLQNTKDPAYNMVVYDAMFDAVCIHNHDRRKRIQTRWKSLFHRASPIEYDYYTRCARQKFSQYPEAIPCIDPNFDHSPRSGMKGVILHNSSPEKWGRFCADVARSVDNPDKNGLLFIKSWNEWGEGNYLEPDLRFGSRYLEETAKALK